ncbi:MAG: hypothetical protein AAB421_01760 [Patescibacteria group bacterium]
MLEKNEPIAKVVGEGSQMPKLPHLHERDAYRYLIRIAGEEDAEERGFFVDQASQMVTSEDARASEALAILKEDFTKLLPSIQDAQKRQWCETFLAQGGEFDKIAASTAVAASSLAQGAQEAKARAERVGENTPAWQEAHKRAMDLFGKAVELPKENPLSNELIKRGDELLQYLRTDGVTSSFEEKADQLERDLAKQSRG